MVKLLWAFALVVSTPAVSASAQAAGASPTPPAWTAPVKPFRIVGNVYYVGTKGLAAYLIKSPQGAVLLDAPLAENASLIERNIRALGVPLHSVRMLLSDHAHYDHVGGLAQLKRDTGAPLAAGIADQPALERGQPPGQVTYAPSPFEAVKVERPVRDGDTVNVGSITMTANSTPGHTPGCTSWSTTTREGGRPVTVLFLCSITVAGNVLKGNTAYPTIAADYRVTSAKLSSMKADVVLSSHPEITDVFDREAKRRPGKPNPFIDPKALAAVVADARADFEESLKAADTPK